jgi:hypothetical protein
VITCELHLMMGPFPDRCDSEAEYFYQVGGSYPEYHARCKRHPMNMEVWKPVSKEQYVFGSVMDS